MFWRVAGYSQPSPLEAILDMDGFSLEDLLDEADLIQAQRRCSRDLQLTAPRSDILLD
jgi:hypothetical protein